MKIFLTYLTLLVTAVAVAGDPPRYEKLHLTGSFWAEGATFADLNNDGHGDAIAGPIWYAGPDFKEKHEIYTPARFDPLSYSDNFFAFPYDFNRDGWMDILVLGFPGKNATWYQNPGDIKSKSKSWIPHVVFEGVDNESPTFGDLLGTGQPVLICNHAKTFGYATFDPDAPERPWTYHPISPENDWGRFHHGLGWGDVNGDGRADVLDRDGWWEQPASLAGDPIWKRHTADFGEGGAQMYVYDVNADGRADVISAIRAHGYGVSWFEQTVSEKGDIVWQEHPITSRQETEDLEGVQFSQPHAIDLVDLDGDGIKDFVTGKRWWAHGTHGDPKPNASPVIYAFLLRRDSHGGAFFQPHLIDDASGVGTQLVAADANRDGKPDLISANKRGTFLFLSQPEPLRPALTTLPLWPNGVPGETETFPAEGDTSTDESKRVAGRPVVRIGNVTQPTLTIYRPDPEINTGAAVVVCPGGGYYILANDLEGTEVCHWLNSLGVTAALLKYRVPRRESVPFILPPLQDAQRAIRVVRDNASKWSVDPSQIGVLGFSAGGHLAAQASTRFNEQTYPKVDATDELSSRPDFALLIYPGYLAVKESPDQLAPELTVSGETPPTFLVMTNDDPVGVDNPLVYFRSLLKADVPAEMHLYPTGGHGYGMRPTDVAVTRWPEPAAEWMRANGWLEDSQSSK